MSRILIAYFSHSGNTRSIAEKLKNITGGELFEIKSIDPYPKNYAASVEKSKAELAIGARPKLVDSVDEFEAYDELILGFPCWCGTMPMPVCTFLEENDVGGKRILPFCSHGGGGIGRSERDIAMLCPGAEVKKCLSIYGSSINEAQLKDWIVSQVINTQAKE